MGDRLDNERHSEFMLNVLFYLAGYIVSKLLDKLTCPGCKRSLVPQPNGTSLHIGHDYAATMYHEAGKASCFTNFKRVPPWGTNTLNICLQNGQILRAHV